MDVLPGGLAEGLHQRGDGVVERFRGVLPRERQTAVEPPARSGHSRRNAQCAHRHRGGDPTVQKFMPCCRRPPLGFGRSWAAALRPHRRRLPADDTFMGDTCRYASAPCRSARWPRFPPRCSRSRPARPARSRERRTADLVSQDGKFGPATLGALQQRQHDFGLSPDGVVGPDTGFGAYAGYCYQVLPTHG
ncbi:peptidoglycan-binding domain-containing protein [Streptomyces nojiriensis]